MKSKIRLLAILIFLVSSCHYQIKIEKRKFRPGIHFEFNKISVQNSQIEAQLESVSDHRSNESLKDIDDELFFNESQGGTSHIQIPEENRDQAYTRNNTNEISIPSEIKSRKTIKHSNKNYHSYREKTKWKESEIYINTKSPAFKIIVTLLSTVILALLIALAFRVGTSLCGPFFCSLAGILLPLLIIGTAILLYVLTIIKVFREK